jgi:hypothetical protein
VSPDPVQLTIQFVMMGHQVVPQPSLPTTLGGTQAGASGEHGGGHHDAADRKDDDRGSQPEQPPSGDGSDEVAGEYVPDRMAAWLPRRIRRKRNAPNLHRFTM